MKEIKINGKNYKLPGGLTKWQQEMYVNLINWKWKNITEEVGYNKHNGELIPYDALFPEYMPHIYPAICNRLKQHQSTKGFYFKFHKYFYHMASSQAANINLFIPFLLNDKADKILHLLKDDFLRLAKDELDNGFRIEYWDGTGNEKGLLNDHTPAAGTDSDIGIAYYNKNNELCLWLIEHKLTEKEFTTCGGYESKANKMKDNCRKNSFHSILKDKELCHYHRVNKYKYWDITETNKEFFVNSDDNAPCPFKKGMNQLWRNQLLALGLEKQGKFKHVYFSVVHHHENKALDSTMNEYKKLIGNNPKFSSFTSKQVIDAAKSVNDKELNKWIEWYKDLYNI
jgi:hypothetical protein